MVLLKILFLLAEAIFILIIGTNAISLIWVLIHKGKSKIPRIGITNFFLFEGIKELEKKLSKQQN